MRMIEITKKYFCLISRLEWICSEQGIYHIDINEEVKGLHIFFYKIYFSLYIRIGRKK